MATREQLKEKFKAGNYPSGEDFGSLIDSFLATGDQINISKVEGLETALANRLTISDGNFYSLRIADNATAIKAEADRAKAAESGLDKAMSLSSQLGFWAGYECPIALTFGTADTVPTAQIGAVIGGTQWAELYYGNLKLKYSTSFKTVVVSMQKHDSYSNYSGMSALFVNVADLSFSFLHHTLWAERVTEGMVPVAFIQNGNLVYSTCDITINGELQRAMISQSVLDGIKKSVNYNDLLNKPSIPDVSGKADADLGNTDYWLTLNNINRRISSVEWNGGYPGVTSPGQYILYDGNNYNGILFVSSSPLRQDMITPEGVKYRGWDYNAPGLGGNWSVAWSTRVDFNDIGSGGEGIADAPVDDNVYGRVNNQWQQLHTVALNGSYNYLHDTPVSEIPMERADSITTSSSSKAYIVNDGSKVGILLHESFGPYSRRQTLYMDGVTKQRAGSNIAWEEWKEMGDSSERKTLFINSETPQNSEGLYDVDMERCDNILVDGIDDFNWTISALPVSDSGFIKEMNIIIPETFSNFSPPRNAQAVIMNGKTYTVDSQFKAITSLISVSAGSSINATATISESGFYGRYLTSPFNKIKLYIEYYPSDSKYVLTYIPII